jgi:UDP-N-acetyl-D-mannosaminuronate dehydrogenase
MKVITKCKNLSKKYNIVEYIKQANLSLLELAKEPETTEEMFQEVANKLKVETGYDIWMCIGQVRGCDDMVKLEQNKNLVKQGVDRDSYTLKLVRDEDSFN